MDFKKHLETAWNLTLKNLAPLILMTLVLIVLGSLTLGILAPVMMAGYFQSILTMIRNGRQPIIQDLFSEMSLFLPLLGFSIVAFIAVIVGFMLFVLPGMAVVFAVAFGCLYLIPLMTDQKMGLVDGLKKSWEMAMQPNIADHVVVAILYVGLIAVGSSVFIGMLLTMPFATVFLASVYRERMAEDQPPAPAARPSSDNTV
jgi:membrane-anchored glycerophosphoryl diester phosphodiesterase (GDPDase)